MATKIRDPWDEVDAHDEEHGPPEERGGEMPQLPAGVWFLGESIAEEGNGWAPDVQRFVRRDGTGVFFQLRMGFRLLGCEGKDGESKADPKRFGNFYCGGQFFIHPNPEKEPDALISGRTTGFLNALFSPGEGEEFLPSKDTPREKHKELGKQRAAARWSHTKAVLKEAGEGINADDYLTPEKNEETDEWEDTGERDLARYLVSGCAVAALMQRPRTILFKTRKEEYTGKDGKVTDVRIGQVEDDTPANRKKRGIVLWGEQAADEDIPF